MSQLVQPGPSSPVLKKPRLPGFWQTSYRHTLLLWLLSGLLGLLVFQFTAGRTPLELSMAGYPDQFLSGFYGIESNPSFSYRWTQARATVQLPQPGLRNELTLWLAAPRSGQPAPIPVTISLNGKQAGQLTLDPAAPPRPYTFTWSALTPFPTADLTIETDRASLFQPPQDGRRLGVIVTQLTVKPVSGPLLPALKWPSPFVVLLYLLLSMVCTWLWGIMYKRGQGSGSRGQRSEVRGQGSESSIENHLSPNGGKSKIETLKFILPSLLLFGIYPLVLIVILVIGILWLVLSRLIPEKTMPESNIIVNEPGKDRVVAALLFSMALLVYSLTTPNQLSSPNEGGHFALVRAISDRASFEIGPYLDYTQRTDYASPAPQLYYSDRPPGTAWLAAPLFFLGERLASAGLLGQSLPLLQLVAQPVSALWFGLNWAMLVPALAGAGAVAFLYKLLRSPLFEVSRRAAWLVAAYYGLATINWKYSTALYSHSLGAFLVLAGLYFFLNGIGRRGWRFYLGLTLLGYAVTVDYTNILPGLAVLAYPLLNWWLDRRKPVQPPVSLGLPRRVKYGLGLALFGLPVVALALYQWICFGSPFSTSYTYTVKWAWARSALTTFDRPPWEGLVPLLFGWGEVKQIYDQGLMRGLLILSPGLILAVAGLPYLWQRRPRLLILLAGLVLPIALLMGAHHTYWGGGDFDARYLLVIVPYLCLPLAFWWDGFVVKRPIAARLGWYILSGLVFSYSLLANLLHLLTDYPWRLFHPTGPVKAGEIGFSPFGWANLPLALLIGLVVISLVAWADRKAVDSRSGQIPAN